MDISKLNLAELRDLLEKAKLEVKHREKKDIAAAREEIYAIAHRLGLPLKNLIGTGMRVTSGKVAVQYRNPADPTQEWTGRGRQPKWVKELIESGQTMDAARV